MVLRKRNQIKHLPEDIDSLDSLEDDPFLYRFLPYVVDTVPVVELDTTEGSTCIYNSQILEAFGRAVWNLDVDHDGRFVYVYTCIYRGQHGGFAIHDTEKGQWIAAHSDELFCPQGILYVPEQDLFIGLSSSELSWHGTSANDLFIVRNGEVTFNESAFRPAPARNPKTSSVQIKLGGDDTSALRYYDESDVVEVERDGQSRYYGLNPSLLEGSIRPL